MTEYVIRFLSVASWYRPSRCSADVLRPKSFAGLFGAAPSVALATLGIAIYQHGAELRRSAKPSDDGWRDRARRL